MKFRLILFVIFLFSAFFNFSHADVLHPRGPSGTPVPALTQASQTTSPDATTTSDKLIVVDLATQTLTYSEGSTTIATIKISSGLRGTPTPKGEFSVLGKYPIIDYKGSNYDFKNTKWNLRFKDHNPLNYYIHGAYWHHNFGHPMSHGCVNVSYADMEPLYNWADVGTRIIIQ